MVGALITRAVVPVLKPLGFKRSGTTFRRERDECIQVVNVQSSQWNDRAAARCTINLGVFFPAVHTELQDLDQSNVSANGPLANQCHLQSRIGELLADGEDIWWRLRPSEPPDAVAAAVEAALSGPGLAWLERFSTPEAVLASPTEPRWPVMTVIAAGVVTGRADLVRAQARSLLEDDPGDSSLRDWLVQRGVLEARG